MASVRDVAAEVVDAALEATVLLSFSNVGYIVRRRVFGWADPVGRQAVGRSAIVTGASTGIGLEIARGIARTGRAVRIVSRDAGSGAAAVATIQQSTGNRDITHHAVDLSSVSATRAFADSLVSSGEAVDIVVHNAGALFRDYQQTAEGVEATVALHVLAPFVLTETLVPLLAHSAPACIVTVTSGGMYTQRLNVDRFDRGSVGYDGVRAYALAKRAQVVLTSEWARRHGGAGIAAHCMHPGWVRTAGLAEALPGFERWLGPILRSPQQGADTAVWLATAAGAAPVGRLWLDRHRRTASKVPLTITRPRDAERLWEWCLSRTLATAP